MESHGVLKLKTTDWDWAYGPLAALKERSIKATAEVAGEKVEY